MNTTPNRTKFVRAAVLAGAAATARRSRQMLIVLALALGAILLALSATVAHAAPGDDGQDTENPANVPPGQTAQATPPQMQASENPVVFHGSQTTKYITVSATVSNMTVRVIWKEDGVQTGPGAVCICTGPPYDFDTIAKITYGKTYTAHLETIPENGLPKLAGPTLTITTVRVDVTTASPQPPKITPTLIPTRPDLPPGGTRSRRA